jgi:hypothetical protein
VSQPMTASYLANQFGRVGIIDNSSGGLSITGISDSDTIPLRLEGYIGSTNPGDTTTPAIQLIGGKDAGDTSIAAVGDAETLLQIFNNITAKFTVLGSGNVGIGTAVPSSKLSVVGLPSYADNAAALVGGLAAGDFYMASGTGVAIKGTVMVAYTP